MTPCGLGIQPSIALFHYSYMIKFKIFGVLVLFGMMSCGNKECDEVQLVEWNVQDVNGPDTISLGEEAIFTVSFGTSNSCAYFENFVTTKKDTVYKVDLMIRLEPCNGCWQVALVKTEEFVFETKKVGTYLFEFGSNKVLDTLVVE